MTQAVAGFVTKVMIHFPFKHESQEREQEWIASMVRNLRGYKAETLDLAAQWFIDNRTDRRFPLPAECKEVCDDIASREVIAKRANELPSRPPELMSDARFALADDLIQRASMSKEAARDGWISALHNYCWEHGMLPTGRDIDKCKQAAKSLDQAFETCVRGEGGACNASLLALGQSMLKRREELRARILGRAA